MVRRYKESMMNVPAIPIKPGSALPPPGDAIVAHFEKVHRVRLPESFVHLLRVANGAVPLRPRVESSQRQRHIERFLCLLDDLERPHAAYDIGVVLTQLDGRLGDDEEEIGSSIIPFAVLFAGDFLCLDYRDDPDAPNVCIWFHEESTEFHPVVETIAPSFDAFLAMMHDRADGD
jgi:SMI1-KNR4 cell-wall